MTLRRTSPVLRTLLGLLFSLLPTLAVAASGGDAQPSDKLTSARWRELQEIRRDGGSRQASGPRVTCNVPSGSYPDIQTALNSPACSTIQIATGVFLGSFVIDRDVILQGQGAGNTLIKGAVTAGDPNADSVFTIQEGGWIVTFEDLTIANGYGENGGGIQNLYGVVDLHGCTIRDNRAVASLLSEGGGIYNVGGILWLDESTVRDNKASLSGGGITNSGLEFGFPTSLGELQNLLEDLRDFDVEGLPGGIAVTLISDSTIRSNLSKGIGGGLHNDFGVVTIDGATISQNTADALVFGYGGGISNVFGGILLANGVLKGNQALSSTAYSGGGAINNVGVHFIESGGYLHIENSVFEGNLANSSIKRSQGGAINNTAKAVVEVSGSTLRGNKAGGGGAIFSDDGGNVTLIDTLIEGNLVDKNLGDGRGGAIRNVNSKLTLLRCTLANNLIDSPAPQGGAIYNFSDTSYLPAELTITSSTFTGNAAQGVLSRGGAIYNEARSRQQSVEPGSALVTIQSSTFYDDNADNGAELYNGADTGGTARITVKGSIVYSPGSDPDSDTDCQSIVVLGFGGIGSQGYNLAEKLPLGSNNVCDFRSTGDVTLDPAANDIKLGLLQDNGGLTPTRALLEGSPAINTGGTACLDSDPNTPDLDQRGVTRPQEAGCDIGAHESANFYHRTLSPLPQALAEGAEIQVTFNKDPDPNSADAAGLAVQSKLHGRRLVATTSSAAKTLSFVDLGLSVGDLVTVGLTGALKSSLGIPLENARQWQFQIGAPASLCPGSLSAQSETFGGGFGQSSVAWGDFDGDGDLDALVIGATSSGVYRYQSGNGFTRVQSLPHLLPSAAAWGDYDGDGDLDFAMAGEPVAFPAEPLLTRIYRNEAGTFVDIDAGLQGIKDGALAWADDDNDGDLDLLVTGRTGNGLDDRITTIDRNIEGVFVSQTSGLPALRDSAADWGDYDNDGDLDLVLSGWGLDGARASVYRNDGLQFKAVKNLDAVSTGAVAWGDSDQDGDLDLLISGKRLDGTQITTLYRNDLEDVFTALNLGLIGIRNGALAWLDFDNDQDLDFLMTGLRTNGNAVTRLCRNDGLNAFFCYSTALPNFRDSRASWGDFDRDGDQDLLMSGWDDQAGVWKKRVFRNQPCSVANDSYATPSGTRLTVAAPGVLNNDRALDGLTARLVTAPTNGSLTLLTTGAFEYTPDTDYNGQDTFFYEALSPQGVIAEAMVTLTVNPKPGLCRASSDDGVHVSVGDTAAALQAAVDAAAPGSTLKVAGTCLGVQTRSGQTQTLYLDKNLTLRGGYSSTNWTTPNPVTQPTTLDAQGLGRVVYVASGRTVTLQDFQLTNGSTALDGGGVYNNDSTLTLTNCKISGCQATGNGGGLYSTSASGRLLTLSQTTISTCTAEDGGGLYLVGSALNLTGSTLDNNTASGNGGGLFSDGGASVSVAVGTSTLRGNKATGWGGGVYGADGTLSITDSSLRDNRAASGAGLASASGGGDFVTVSRSTLNGNVASDSGGAVLAADGPVVLSNCSLSGNQATNSGGGLAVHAAAVLTLHNVTVAENTAPAAAAVQNLGSVTVDNSILASTGTAACADPNQPTVPLNSAGYNLASDSSCGLAGTGDLIGQLPRLRPLQQNGGPTETHALLYGSPAIDLGSPATPGSGGSACQAVDQRGVSRPLGSRCDIGAYESPVLTNCRARNFRTGTVYENLNGPNGADVVQAAIDDAVSGDLIQLAGYCAGVKTVSGKVQTAHVTKPLTLRGGYAENDWVESLPALRPTTLDALGLGRAVYLTSFNGILALEDLNFVNGRGYPGGSIYLASSGTANELEITRCKFAGNSMDPTNVSESSGGAIYFSSGGTRSSLRVADSSFDGNVAEHLGGGAISISRSNATIVRSTFSRNQVRSSTSFGGGAIEAWNNTALTIQDSVFIGNFVPSGGSGGALIVYQGATATLERCLFQENWVKGFGGAISTSIGNPLVTITDSTFTNNYAEIGGAVALRFKDAQMTLRNSALTGNQTREMGYITGFTAGGALYNTATLNLINSTVSGNSGEGDGGGIANIGSLDPNNPGGFLTITNSTIAFNTAYRTPTSGEGGGIFSSNGMPVVTISNSVIAGNSAIEVGDDCRFFGTFTSLGHNLDSDATCNLVAVGDRPGNDPLLLALADNGGPTLTLGLQSRSPAINAGDCAAGTVTTDQTGKSRPEGTACDIGAFESVLRNTTTDLSGPQEATVSGQSARFTATVTGNPVPTGLVTFQEGATILGSVPLDASGVAVFTTTSLALGSHEISATYLGDADLDPSTSPTIPHSVGQSPSVVSLFAHQPDPSVLGEPLPVSLQVVAAEPGSGTPTGTVTVGDGVSSCQVQLPATSCNLLLLTSGVKVLTASYGGDASFLASTSAGDAHTVVDPPPPGVTQVDTLVSPGDSLLTPGRTTSQSVTQLAVTFSMPMAQGPVESTSSSLLLEAKGDGFETESCATGVSSGDQSVPISTVDYDGGTRIATLQLQSGSALADGFYRLHICGTLVAENGTALDGNGDGTSGDDFTLTFRIDTVSPQPGIEVLSGSSSLASGAITNAEIQDLRVNFDELLSDPEGSSDPHDVTNPENYLLLRSGQDPTFETMTCAAGVSASDTAVAVDLVTYDGTAARLVVNAGLALPDARYRLLACGTTSLMDLAGNKLDGNRDGQSGDDFALDFIADRTAPAAPANLSSSSHSVGIPVQDATLDVSWSAATDNLSGVAGYAYTFDAQPTGSCDAIQDLPDTVTSVSSPALPNGSWYVHVCAVDRPGNWGLAATAGPYVIGPPFTPTATPSPTGAQVSSNPGGASGITLFTVLVAGLIFGLRRPRYQGRQPTEGNSKPGPG